MYNVVAILSESEHSFWIFMLLFVLISISRFFSFMHAKFKCKKEPQIQIDGIQENIGWLLQDCIIYCIKTESQQFILAVSGCLLRELEI